MVRGRSAPCAAVQSSRATIDMPVAPDGRWPPVYDAQQLADIIGDLAGADDFDARFWDLRRVLDGEVFQSRAVRGAGADGCGRACSSFALERLSSLLRSGAYTCPSSRSARPF